jgi:RND family efflux transporter MFP subunit
MTVKLANRTTAALVLASLLSGCGRHAPDTEKAPPAVTVSAPDQQQVSDYLELTGTVAPSQSVDLVARVTGYLQLANFQDGSLVQAGDLLFQIEPDTYKQDLASAEASLRRAQAEYNRQELLRQKNATSTANVEKWLSDLESAKAQVELAKLNLGYTSVKAPFNGRIGRRLVDPGNLVGPSVNTKLGTLQQIQPIYVYFNLNERDALRLWESIRRRNRDNQEEMRKTVVEVGVQNEAGYPHAGTLDFVDTGVSTASGAINMRAVLQNQDKALFPGLFARVRIAIGAPQPMLVVPNAALGNDQEGDYLLVVDASGVVTRRAVVKGTLIGKGCAIRSGLTSADRVITVGLTRARPGMKVTPETASASRTNTAGAAR